MFKRKIVEFLTTGMPTKGDVLLMRQLAFVKSFSVISLLFLVYFIYHNFFDGKFLMVAVEVVCFIAVASSLFCLRSKKNIDCPTNILVVTIFILLFSLPLIQQDNHFSVVWTLFFPVLVVQLKGPKASIMWIFVFYACLLPPLYLGIDSWMGGHWDIDYFISFCVASLMMSYCSFFNEISLAKSYQALTHAQHSEKNNASRNGDTMVRILDKRNSLLTDLSHELRTPLCVIQLHLELLEDGIAEDPTQTFQLLHGKLNEVGKMINDLHKVTIAGMGELYIQKSPTYICSTIKKSLDAYQLLAQRYELTLEEHIDLPTDLKLLIDEERIMQVFTNLFQNSVRYTDAGGRLMFTATDCDEFVVLSLSDSGPGVTDDELSKLCDRLYQTESVKNKKGGGSGIGLSICRSIINAHRGHIHLSHSILGGVEVTINLPKAVEKEFIQHD